MLVFFVSLSPIKKRQYYCLLKVRMEGLEPTHLTALDPKSSASTNFATSAKLRSANVASFQNNAIDNLKILNII